MFQPYDYDRSDPKSLENYAKNLEGKTFSYVVNMADSTDNIIAKESLLKYNDPRRKGGLGNLVEELYFGYPANSDSSADFSEAGVELKVTPYEKNKNGELRAGERLVLTMISYEEPVEFDFNKSHFWKKCRILLIIYYWRKKELENNLFYPISFVKLFTPPEDDLAIIKQDYDFIVNKIAAGKAHELSEGDTMYLGACTKGATAAKSIVPQHYSSIPARKRAFCYKTSYMTFVLRNYISQNIDTCESIIKDVQQLRTNSFESIILTNINHYSGYSDKQLCDCFGIEYTGGKAQWITLAYKMLGINSNKAEEFLKANIVVKAIRLEKNGKMRESSPLPNMRMKEFANEIWEDSQLYLYFEQHKFLFVVFKHDGTNYILKGAQLWNMPISDLETTVYSGWHRSQKIVQEGLILTPTKTNAGIVIKNNLPAKAENSIIHIRPHTQKSFYDIDGKIYGKGSRADGDELPDGRWITKQSFWLNNTYIVEQLNETLKK